MVDLLKTSTQVTVTVLEPLPNSTPRRGCWLPTCKFNIINFEDYEVDGKKLVKQKSTGHTNNPPRRRYERNFSPPRSSNSSGYGTGSSSRSFSIPNIDHHPNTMRYISGTGADHMGTLTSSSSGHSSNEDRWYDIPEAPDDSENFYMQQSQPQQPHYPQIQQKVAQYTTHPKLTHSSSASLNNNGIPRPLTIHDPQNSATPRKSSVEYVGVKQPKVQEFNNMNGNSGNSEKSIGRNIIKGPSPDGSQTDTSSINLEPIYNLSRKSTSTTDEEMCNGLSQMEVTQLKRSTTANNVYKSKSSKSKEKKII